MGRGFRPHCRLDMRTQQGTSGLKAGGGGTMGAKAKAPKTPKAESVPGVTVDEVEPVLIETLALCRMFGITPGCWRMRVKRGMLPEPDRQIGSRHYYRTEDVRHYLDHKAWPPGMKFRRPPEAESRTPA